MAEKEIMQSDHAPVANKPRAPRVLTVVYSAGVDPWLAIEDEGQRPIIEGFGANYGETIWFRGNPNVSGQRRFEFLSRLIMCQIKFLYRPSRGLRSVFHKVWQTGRWNALGHHSLRRILRQNYTRVEDQLHSTIIESRLPVQASLAGMRTIDIFNFALRNYEFDYLLRITSTCLPVPPQVEKLVASLPRERVFGGQFGDFFGQRFISGAAVLLSRDVVHGVVENSREFLFNVYEDVALSKIIEKKNLGDWYDIPYTGVRSPEDVQREFSSNPPQTLVVRCKAESPITTISEPVVNVMVAVSKHL